MTKCLIRWTIHLFARENEHLVLFIAVSYCTFSSSDMPCAVAVMFLSTDVLARSSTLDV